MILKGAITALITPFINGELDEEGLRENVHFQVKEGIHGVLALGSTGESPTISSEEQTQIIQIVVKEAKGKVPVLIGTGSNCTRKTIEQTKKAKDLGADVAFIVVPYYNKPTQDGLLRHFEAVANSVDLPIILYNAPTRTGINIQIETILKLAEISHIIAIKEASGNMVQAGDLISALNKKFPHFSVLSDDDILALPMMSLGARGVVSVAGNIIPRLMVQLVNLALQGDFVSAKNLHHQLLPLFKASFIETNPIPIKAAMSLCGLPSGECRLPLAPLSPENHEKLKQTLIELHLLPNEVGCLYDSK